MHNYHQPLIPGETYHLFSRAVGDEKLFLCDENYRYFLSKCKLHVEPVAEFFSYSLLPNHFHLVARIKQADQIIPVYEMIKKKQYSACHTDLPDFIMERFSNWLNSYTKAFNKMYHRKGALFMDYLKRSRAENDRDFVSYVFYVHKNAVHHGLATHIGDWPFDSYKSILSNSSTNLLRDELLNWFDGREAFIQFHQQPVELKSVGWTDT